VSDSEAPLVLAGVDTGGTFTDLIVLDGEELRVHKVLSTPDAPERAILQGLADLGADPERLRLRHGSTVATNAVLEGKGVRTAYVTNRGLADILTIARQNRSQLYDLSPEPEPPPVPEALCLETGGRLAADGTVVEPLTRDDIEALLERLRELDPEAVAINLLFSFVDDRFEAELATAIAGEGDDGPFVARSSAVLAEIGEYERGIATWLNAYIGPRTGAYLRRLRDGMPGAHVAEVHGGPSTSSSTGSGRSPRPRRPSPGSRTNSWRTTACPCSCPDRRAASPGPLPSARRWNARAS